jgi:hypothetical protein
VDEVLAAFECDGARSALGRGPTTDEEHLTPLGSWGKNELCDDREADPLSTAWIDDGVARLGAYVGKDLTTATKRHGDEVSAEITESNDGGSGIADTDDRASDGHV